MAYAQRLQLAGYLLLKPLHALHEVGVLLAQPYVLLLQQPPGQPAHFPFGTGIGPRAHNDVEAVLLGQSAESGHVALTAEVELSFGGLVEIPEYVDAQGVHSQGFAHLDAVLPVGARNARIVHLGRLHHEGLAVEHKAALACLETARLLGSRDRRQHQQQRAEQQGDYLFSIFHLRLFFLFLVRFCSGFSANSIGLLWAKIIKKSHIVVLFL